MPLGGALASLTSMVTSAAHWRLMFLVGGLVPLALTPVLQWTLQETESFVGRAVPAGAASSGAESVRAGSFAAILAGGRALTTLLLWVSSFLGLLTLYLLLSWLPTLLIGDGLSNAQAAAAQVAFNLGGAASVLVVGRLLEGRIRTPAIVLTCAAVPLFLHLLARAPPRWELVVVIVFALGCAVIATQGVLYAFAPQSYPTRIRGVAMGAVVAAGRVGSIVGPKLGGLLKAAGHGSAQLLTDIMPLVIAGSVAVLLFALGRRPAET
jgi:MFS transporter, AAHS family, 3-hydroxyphenylpropionic acid transporter